MTSDELKEILRLNKLWLNGESGGVRADLRYCIGNGREIKSLQCDTYLIAYTQEIMAIGCQQHSIVEWWGFSDAEIRTMDGLRALEWWRKWKPILELVMRPETKIGGKL